MTTCKRYPRTLDNESDKELFEEWLCEEVTIKLFHKSILLQEFHEEIPTILEQNLANDDYVEIFDIWSTEQDTDDPRWQCEHCGTEYYQTDEPECCAKCDVCDEMRAIEDMLSVGESGGNTMYICDTKDCREEFGYEDEPDGMTLSKTRREG